MASITATKTQGGDRRWIVRYRDDTGRSRERWFVRKAEALRYRAQVEVDLSDGTWIEPSASNQKAGPWITQWFEARSNIRPSTKTSQEGLLRNHVLPEFGHKRLASINTSHIDNWIAALGAKGLAPSTIRSVHHLLRSSLEAACRDRLLPRNPAVGVSLPRDAQREMRVLTPNEVLNLTDCMNQQARCMTLFGALAGLRWGETAALRLQSLDLLRRRITVTHTLTQVEGQMVLGPPKTPKSKRSLTIPKRLVAEIEAHLATGVKGHDGLIFTTSNGTPLWPRNWRRRIWSPAVAATVGEPLRYHDLRRTHVAMLIEQGQHPKLIQERLGHSSIRTTLDVYGHLFRGIDEAAADAIDVLFPTARSHA